MCTWRQPTRYCSHKSSPIGGVYSRRRIFRPAFICIRKIDLARLELFGNQRLAPLIQRARACLYWIEPCRRGRFSPWLMRRAWRVRRSCIDWIWRSRERRAPKTAPAFVNTLARLLDPNRIRSPIGLGAGLPRPSDSGHTDPGYGGKRRGAIKGALLSNELRTQIDVTKAEWVDCPRRQREW